MESYASLIRAVQRATRKLASSGRYDELLRDVLAICIEATGAEGGTIYLHDAEAHRLRFQHVLPEEIGPKLPVRDVPDDYGAAGQAFTERRAVCRTFPAKSDEERNDFERATGVTVRSMLAAPLSMEDEEPIGVVQLLNKHEGSFDEMDIAVMDTVSAVATMGFHNVQLVEQQARAQSLLGMGRVSHDIGNLAASLVAQLNVGDQLGDRVLEMLPRTDPARPYAQLMDDTFTDLKESVDRIVRYSHLISDMSAGRPLRPELRVAQMADSVRDAAASLESDGRSSGILIRYDIDLLAPPTCFDEMYITRIVQNLVGNAIKAVRETMPEEPLATFDEDMPLFFGEVKVRYCYADEKHRIEVTDTGPGMNEATVDRILSGNAQSRWERAGGSGLGTRIVLELTGALDGHVGIVSSPGEGSSFRVTLPHRDC
ncbi:hypothetical protein BH11ARM2_BH11ARM2_17190 [soil metagenome]